MFRARLNAIVDFDPNFHTFSWYACTYYKLKNTYLFLVWFKKLTGQHRFKNTTGFSEDIFVDLNNLAIIYFDAEIFLTFVWFKVIY